MATATTKNNAQKSTMVTKTMPHNLEAEQSVLGCILIDNDASITAFGILVEDDFYSATHKLIFGAMRVLFDRNSPVDLVTLSSALSKNGKIENIGGIDYLTSLSDIVPSSANLRHYIEILKRNSVLRKVIAAGNKIVADGYSGADDENAVLAAAEKTIFDISREGERKDLTPMGAELPGVLERLDTIQRDPTAMRGLKTGFYGLDDITNGLQKSTLVIIAARPGVGKTSFGLNIITNTAIKRKAKCAVFSLEMSKQELTMRALCSVACVDIGKANKGELDAEELKRIFIANKELAAADIYIDDNSVITPAEIMSKCMRLKREKGLDLVMVDYLGLMTGGNNKRESRQVEVADNSRYMKILSKELEVPVMLISQLNRGVEKRVGMESRPVLSDLRESGAIEQDADIVMFIHSEKTDDNQEESSTSERELIIAKHRNGPQGIVKLKWMGPYTTFMNMQSQQYAQDARDQLESKKQPKQNKPQKEEIKPEQISSVSSTETLDVF